MDQGLATYGPDPAHKEFGSNLGKSGLEDGVAHSRSELSFPSMAPSSTAPYAAVSCLCSPPLQRGSSLQRGQHGQFELASGAEIFSF